MRYGSIYIVTNSYTGDRYVGQTRQPVHKRWDAHWRTATCITSRKAKFQNALIEFGKDAFVVDEIFVAFDAETLNFAEIAVITDLQPAYNSSRGGKGLRPIVVSDATKAKRSEAAKTRWANPEWKAKTMASIKLAAQTPEATARGRALRLHKGSEKRWAGHVKKPAPLPKIKTCKQKRNPAVGRMLTAQAKWKPVYCPELQCSFLSQKAAAEFLGVLRTSVCNAVKQKGKVAGKFTLKMVN